MKTLIIILLFILIGFGASAQTDTVIISNVVSKKVTVRVVSVDTSQVTTEIKETIDYNKAVSRIEKLAKDTTQLSQQFTQINQFEAQIQVEKQRVIKQYRESVKLIDRLKKLLPSLL